MYCVGVNMNNMQFNSHFENFVHTSPFLTENPPEYNGYDTFSIEWPKMKILIVKNNYFDNMSCIAPP